MIGWLKRRQAGEIRVLSAAALALPLTQMALRFASLPAVRHRLWRVLSAGHPLPPESRLSIGRVLRCVDVASRVSPLPCACLATALVAQALLHRHGYQARLRIGVRGSRSGQFAAHAWLERDGLIVVGGPPALVAQYQALPDLEHLIV